MQVNAPAPVDSTCAVEWNKIAENDVLPCRIRWSCSVHAFPKLDFIAVQNGWVDRKRNIIMQRFKASPM